MSSPTRYDLPQTGPSGTPSRDVERGLLGHPATRRHGASASVPALWVREVEHRHPTTLGTGCSPEEGTARRRVQTSPRGTPRLGCRWSSSPYARRGRSSGHRAAPPRPSDRQLARSHRWPCGQSHRMNGQRRQGSGPRRRRQSPRVLIHPSRRPHPQHSRSSCRPDSALAPNACWKRVGRRPGGSVGRLAGSGIPGHPRGDSLARLQLVAPVVEDRSSLDGDVCSTHEEERGGQRSCRLGIDCPGRQIGIDSEASVESRALLWWTQRRTGHSRTPRATTRS